MEPDERFGAYADDIRRVRTDDLPDFDGSLCILQNLVENRPGYVYIERRASSGSRLLRTGCEKRHREAVR